MNVKSPKPIQLESILSLYPLIDGTRSVEAIINQIMQEQELTGGEFTLHPRYRDIIQFAYEKMDLIALLTNGTIITKEIIRSLNPFRDRLMWSISLDSSDKDFFEKFRGSQGAYDKVCRTIRTLSEEGHMVKVSMSLIEDNIDHLIPTMDFVYHDLKASAFGYSPVLPVGRGKNVETIFSAESIRKMEEARNYSKKYGKFVNWMDSADMDRILNHMNNCGAGWKNIVIGPNGVVRACIMADEEIMFLGNILEQPIEEIMSQDIVQTYHDITMPNKKLCANCYNKNFCGYCSYRGILTNIERKNQGLDYCDWVKNNKIGSLIEHKKSVQICIHKKCGI